MHRNPECKINELCDFLEFSFEFAMIEPERWDGLFDKNFVDANISSYNKKKVYGFDPSRSDRWKNKISDWELNLCEHLAKEQLAFCGYKKSMIDLDPISLKKGMEKLKNNYVHATQSILNYLGREPTRQLWIRPIQKTGMHQVMHLQNSPLIQATLNI